MSEVNSVLSLLALGFSFSAALFALQSKWSADRSSVTLDKVHVLVNSNMATQLAMHAVVTRRLANITGDPVDEVAADVAADLDHDHMGKQQKLDAAKVERSITGQEETSKETTQ